MVLGVADVAPQATRSSGSRSAPGARYARARRSADPRRQGVREVTCTRRARSRAGPSRCGCERARRAGRARRARAHAAGGTTPSMHRRSPRRRGREPPGPSRTRAPSSTAGHRPLADTQRRAVAPLHAEQAERAAHVGVLARADVAAVGGQRRCSTCRRRRARGARGRARRALATSAARAAAPPRGRWRRRSRRGTGCVGREAHALHRRSVGQRVEQRRQAHDAGLRVVVEVLLRAPLAERRRPDASDRGGTALSAPAIISAALAVSPSTSVATGPRQRSTPGGSGARSVSSEPSRRFIGKSGAPGMKRPSASIAPSVEPPPLPRTSRTTPVDRAALALALAEDRARQLLAEVVAHVVDGDDDRVALAVLDALDGQLVVVVARGAGGLRSAGAAVEPGRDRQLLARAQHDRLRRRSHVGRGEPELLGLLVAEARRRDARERQHDVAVRERRRRARLDLQADRGALRLVPEARRAGAPRGRPRRRSTPRRAAPTRRADRSPARTRARPPRARRPPSRSALDVGEVPRARGVDVRARGRAEVALDGADAPAERVGEDARGPRDRRALEGRGRRRPSPRPRRAGAVRGRRRTPRAGSATQGTIAAPSARAASQSREPRPSSSAISSRGALLERARDHRVGRDAPEAVRIEPVDGRVDEARSRRPGRARTRAGSAPAPRSCGRRRTTATARARWGSRNSCDRASSAPEAGASSPGAARRRRGRRGGRGDGRDRARVPRGGIGSLDPEQRCAGGERAGSDPRGSAGHATTKRSRQPAAGGSLWRSGEEALALLRHLHEQRGRSPALAEAVGVACTRRSTSAAPIVST